MKLYISESIKRLRLSKGLTQEALSERLGVSFQSVSRWETGASYPDIELIPEIAAFFSVTTDELMGVERATMEQNLVREKNCSVITTGNLRTILRLQNRFIENIPMMLNYSLIFQTHFPVFPKERAICKGLYMTISNTRMPKKSILTN